MPHYYIEYNLDRFTSKKCKNNNSFANIFNKDNENECYRLTDDNDLI
jgi:hypothetical protein